ncbi:MAG: glycosyltransferase family 2 protein [bacterium]|nr:glycosyltransferase family 2 protein [bacterium]
MNQTTKPTAVIILPTYNEKNNIKKLIPALFDKVLPKVKNWRFKILVVDDNSPDGTADQVRKLQAKYQNLDLLTGQKQGLGKAYHKGMDWAVKTYQPDVLIQMDADLSHDPALIPQILDKLENGCDVVIGNRYIKGGAIPADWSLKRKFLSFCGNFVASLMLFNWSVRDWTSGYKAIKTAVFQDIKDEMNKKRFNGYTWQIALVNKAIQHNYKIGFVPLKFTDRRIGQSKLGSEYIFNTLFYLIIDVVKNPPRFYRFALIGFFGFLVNFFGLAFFSQLIKANWADLSVGVRNTIANSIAAELSIISNFILNNLWTFGDRKLIAAKDIIPQFVKFNLSSFATGILIPSLVIGLGTSIFGDQYRQLILVLVIVVFTVPANYFIYNKFIWKDKK